MPKKGEYSKTATADSIRQRKFNSTEKQKTRRAEKNSTRPSVILMYPGSGEGRNSSLTHLICSL